MFIPVLTSRSLTRKHHASGWGGACSMANGELLLVAGAHMSELQGRVIFDDRCFVLRE